MELLFSLGCIFQTLSLVHRWIFFIVCHFEGILGATYKDDVLNQCLQNTIFNINHFTNRPVFIPEWDVITHFQKGSVTFECFAPCLTPVWSVLWPLWGCFMYCTPKSVLMSLCTFVGLIDLKLQTSEGLCFHMV